MLGPKRNIFRDEALEELSSPERLDKLIKVIGPMTWVPLITLGSLIGVGLVWSIWGRIPITVRGKGILVQPRRVVSFQSPISGQLESFAVSVGDCVEKGEQIAKIDPIGLKQKLELTQTKLTQLQEQAAQSQALRTRQLDLEKQAIASAKRSMTESLQNIQTLAPVVRERNLAAIAKQRSSLQQQLNHKRSLAPVLAEQWQVRQVLAKEGALAKETILEAEQQYLQVLDEISGLEASLEQLDAEETAIEQQYLTNLNNISEIQASLQDLAAQQTQSEQQALENANSKKNQIQATEREIAQLQQQIRSNSRILSPQSGCVLETTVTAGQVVSTGTALGTLSSDLPDTQPIGITYFPVKDGKKIKAGMEIQITPDTVKRTRFGSIIGNVTSVSNFPVTTEGVASTLGNLEVARALVPQGSPQMEIRAMLELDESTPSGYKWSSSSGPPLTISDGTTITAIAKIEERAPITFLLPILREWTGIN